MAPIRRYLRITKYSVLEVRIYLHEPALAQTWFLDPRNPALPRVIQAIRPLVLPKLREENERAKGRGKKHKGVKDTVSGDDFQVSIFLTDSSSRHCLLTKQKTLHQGSKRLQSNSKRLTGWLVGSADKPVDIENNASVVVREESDDEQPALQDYPEREVSDETWTHDQSRRLGKRRRSNDQIQVVADESEDEIGHVTPEEDDKKKFAMDTAYDGFSIYPRILCLVVKHTGGSSKIPGSSTNETGEQLLENWVSTQAAQEQIIEDQ